LACPDWPLCFGQVFPKMEGGVLVEHSHRLVAATVGVLTIVLLVWLAKRGLWALGAFALFLVVAQGVLGGLTVIYRLPTWISTTHLAVSQIFFCTLIYVAMRTRPAADRPALPAGVKRAALAAAGAIYVQMLLGALMRHLGAGLACVDVPLCQGSPWGTHWAVKLHMLHRWLGVAVLLVVTWASVVAFRGAQGNKWVRAWALAAPLLVVVQITLGILSITSFLAVEPVIAHLGVAALMLGGFFMLHLTARGDAYDVPGKAAPVAARGLAA
jgi:heme A synthase